MEHKIRKVVRHLRSKSNEQKKQILMVSMTSIVVLMFFLWVWSLGTDLSNPETKTKVKQDLQPFSILKDNILEVYKDSKNPVVE